jgi:hypothetical protein
MRLASAAAAVDDLIVYILDLSSMPTSTKVPSSFWRSGCFSDLCAIPATALTKAGSCIIVFNLSSKLHLQSLVHDLGVGISFRGLHDLAYKETKQTLFARSIAFDLLRICSQDLFNDRIDFP